MSTPHVLEPLLRKLQLWADLDEQDQAAVLALPFIERQIESGHYVVREGDTPTRACLLLSGFAFRQKLTGEGRRQILSVHMRGDLVDLENTMLGEADHNVQMLSVGRVAMIPIDTLQTLAFKRPRVGLAMWYETLVDGSIFREWILNVGRRDGRTRLAHLLCEIGLRLKAAELSDLNRYELPLTQEQLADCTGLTPVHVNRMLRELSEAGLISRTQRTVTIGDWQNLSDVGDFDPRYLHLQRTRLKPQKKITLS